MKISVVPSALILLLIFLSCGDSAVSIMDPDGVNTLSAPLDDPGHAEICHSNMRVLSNAICMFYGMTNRFPDSLGELEMVEPGLCSLTCPSCSLTYMYDLSGHGEVWTVTCPLPVEPNHGNIVNGQSSWPPGSGGGIDGCRSNMRSLGSACAMFYGSENRYPVHLKELEIEGIMENWDLVCPDCGELYSYYSDPAGTTYVIQCPLPWDPGHGFIEDGCISW